MAGGVHGRGACVAHTSPPTQRDTVGQCAGGTHPTGMRNACLFINLFASSHGHMN